MPVQDSRFRYRSVMTLSDLIYVGILSLACTRLAPEYRETNYEYFPHSPSNSQCTIFGPGKEFSQAVGLSVSRTGRPVNPIYHPSLAGAPRLMLI
jgi:hypothetical protein